MNFPLPPPDNWNEKIPGDENFEDTKRRLSEELQTAAMKLLSHLKVASLRLRLTGSPHGKYLTIGGGRHTDEYPARGDRTEAKMDNDAEPSPEGTSSSFADFPQVAARQEAPASCAGEPGIQR